MGIQQTGKFPETMSASMSDATEANPLLHKDGLVHLNASDVEGSTFRVVHTDVTANMTNHIDATQTITLVLVLERSIT